MLVEGRPEIIISDGCPTKSVMDTPEGRAAQQAKEASGAIQFRSIADSPSAIAIAQRIQAAQARRV